MKPPQVSYVSTFEVAVLMAEVIPDLVSSLGSAKIGTLPKDKPQGKLADEWNKA